MHNMCPAAKANLLWVCCCPPWCCPADTQCEGIECSGASACYGGACVCHAGYSGASCAVHEGSVDQQALLDFKAGGDAASRSALQSWGVESEPCGAGGWNTLGSESGGSGGWVGVMCDGAGGRVTVVGLDSGSGSGIVGDVGALAPLGELRVLSLSGNRGVVGDVGRLGSLAELRLLWLSRTSVHGEVGALAGLGHLGERWRGPDGNTYPYSDSGLTLAGSSVWGPVSSVRLVGGLGSGWGSVWSEFSACSGYSSSCELSGLPPVANGSSVAGVDECACCVGSALERDVVSGGCTVSGAHTLCLLRDEFTAVLYLPISLLLSQPPLYYYLVHSCS
eukprot:COSAG06_NODE_6083_length_3119_cov_5.621854_2_plen_335_part_00